jgi:hypothetical protein
VVCHALAPVTEVRQLAEPAWRVHRIYLRRWRPCPARREPLGGQRQKKCYRSPEGRVRQRGFRYRRATGRSLPGRRTPAGRVRGQLPSRVQARGLGHAGRDVAGRVRAGRRARHSLLRKMYNIGNRVGQTEGLPVANPNDGASHATSSPSVSYGNPVRSLHIGNFPFAEFIRAADLVRSEDTW